MKIRPYDLGIWFSQIDVNILSAAEADDLAQFDISSEAGLERMVRGWIAPRFAANNDISQRSMREVLSLSHQWTDAEIEHVFNQFSYPAPAPDINLLMSTLRKAFLN